MESQQQQVLQAQPPRPLLTQEERNDLRKRVLSGIPLTLDEAQQVIASVRSGGAAAILAAGEAKPKKSRTSKTALSDDALDADLAGLGL